MTAEEYQDNRLSEEPEPRATGTADPNAMAKLRRTLEATRDEPPICPGCTEANGTEGWAVVRHEPPLCRTNAEMQADPLSLEPIRATVRIPEKP